VHGVSARNELDLLIDGAATFDAILSELAKASASLSNSHHAKTTDFSS
jgi:hypothetical protein